VARADEGGVSFWLPGLFGSLAAAPLQPGWSVAETFYHTSVWGGKDVAVSREITIGRFNPTLHTALSASVQSDANLVFASATYVFASPVLGGQATIGLAEAYGQPGVNLSANVTGTLGPIPFSRSDMIASENTGFSDLYPMATLRWNKGVDNYMVYVTGDLPVGAYDSSRLSNMGIGHGAIDSGAGYTYFNPQTGHEFSAVTGFTYNFLNPSTQYQNGIDWHLDWGASQFINKAVLIGAVGYVYQQVTGDSGSGDHLGPFLSRVIGIGPQVGMIFPMNNNLQGYLNFKGYAEFDQQNRAAGWNAWITFVISPAAQPPASAQPLVRK